MIKVKEGILYATTIAQFMSGDERLADYEFFGDAFYNCRESGICFSVYKKGYADTLYIWVHNERHSDKCIIRWDKETEGRNMYTDTAYEKQYEYFEEFDPYKAVKYIRECVEEFFENAKKWEE